MHKQRIVSPGSNDMITNEYGEPERVPAGWSFLPAGDAGITRKVTAEGKFWRVQIKKGRRTISKGIWAPHDTIEWAKKEVQNVRSTEAYAKKQSQAKIRRDQKQNQYKTEFRQAVRHYLNFRQVHAHLEQKMADAVTAHAIPIGSGTVARTTTIPIEQRAARAVIAWMRHNTTAYDTLKIARIKGERRAVRRMYAEQSSKLLRKYRKGETISKNCPLYLVLLQS